ncbi:MAG: asparagine synthase (glutamine-hydrolyzing) [Candidatus Marinimicrobia bacterium]|nr:asparagine synthase (glutamine-hydrolyzing) [Candidatus Neomarinimicrobiota bacterium]|tara:strand:+ start:478 stop:2406 length:1929 start_codon:yes stop_codon:yes gene_type:complete
MCGISGIKAKGDQKNNIQLMCDLLDHRGPENSSFYNYKEYWLGHNRLRIIDIKNGDQPMFSHDKSIAVVFNGEIYNYQSLKLGLESKGYKFKTASDTEVLIYLYLDKGLKMFDSLNGIFAFAILDKNCNRLILARDHFGVKPLFYYHQNGNLIFASESKAILSHPMVNKARNKNAIHLLSNLRYVQSEETIFKGIYSIPPGCFMKYENNSYKIMKYYDFNPKIDPLDSHQAQEGIIYHFKNAVQKQLISDVPVGVYLSGGIDSSAIVAIMSDLGLNDISTFTLGFNEPTDEFESAKIISDRFNTNHHKLNLNLNPLQGFPNVIWHSEVPKINLLQGFAMSSFVSKHVKVVLGGLGGDELFAGYDIHKIFYMLRSLNKIIPKSMEKLIGTPLGKIISALQRSTGILKMDEYRRGLETVLASGNILKQLLILRNVWDQDSSLLAVIYTPDFIRNGIRSVKDEFKNIASKYQNKSYLDQVLSIEFQTKMVNDYLWTEDRMSMANSVEQRVPFLDKDLVEFSFSIPAELKLIGGNTKSILRASLNDFLPKEIINKKKWGFSVNPYLQFKKDLKSTIEKILTKEYIHEQGIFNYSYIKSILDYKPHPKLRWHYNFLWILTGLAIWEKMYIKTDMYLKKNHELKSFYN